MLILPVVGSTPGANGTFFRTSVQLHNPSSTLIGGRIVFHPSGLSGSDSDPSLFYSLAPGQTQTYADLLPAMDRSGVGSADIEVTSGSAPVAMVHVFNDAGPSGTTGFTEEPMREEEALRPGQNAVLLIPSDLAAFRFNIGVRTLDTDASMTFTVREASGAVVATVARSFPAIYHIQQGASELLERATLPAGGSVTVALDSGNAILYGATVDNTTGDPSLQIARPTSSSPTTSDWTIIVTTESLTGDECVKLGLGSTFAPTSGAPWLIIRSEGSITLRYLPANFPTDNTDYTGTLSGSSFVASRTDTVGPRAWTCSGGRTIRDPQEIEQVSGSFSSDDRHFEAVEVETWRLPSGEEATARRTWSGTRR
jgi:hypothetical protein